MLSQEELMEHIKVHTKKVWCGVQKFREGVLTTREMWDCDQHHLLLKYYLTVENVLSDSSDIWFAREAIEAYEQFRKRKIVV